MRNFQTRATLLLAGILLVVAGPAWAQGTPGGQTEAYRSFPLIGSRLAVWGAAQLHLYFAAFILGVPMFAIIVEFIGWGGQGKRHEWVPPAVHSAPPSPPPPPPPHCWEGFSPLSLSPCTPASLATWSRSSGRRCGCTPDSSSSRRSRSTSTTMAGTGSAGRGKGSTWAWGSSSTSGGRSSCLWPTPGSRS